MRRISAGTVTVGVIAILLSLVAAYSVRQMLAQPRVEKKPTISIVVARTNLTKNGRVSGVDLVLQPLAEGLVPKEGMITKLSVAAGRYAKINMEAGQAVMEKDLYGIGETPSLADQLEPGYRALKITVDDANAAAGLVKPKSVIDIALTVEGDHPDFAAIGKQRGIGTLTLLRAVHVLTTDGPASIAGMRVNSSTSSRNNLTVAVTPEQANKLILAQRYGKLSVTLVGDKEAAAAKTAGTNEHHIVNPRSLLGLKPVPKPSVPFQAEIYRGEARQIIEFEPARIQEAIAATEADRRREQQRNVVVSTIAFGSNQSDRDMDRVQTKITGPIQ